MENNWQRKILTIWFGQSISLLTSIVFQMCVVWYLTEQTGSAAVLTTAVIAAFVPQAIIGMFTGVVVDRFDKKKIIILSDLFVAITSLILAGVVAFGHFNIIIVYIVLAIRSIGTALHEPATSALTPMLVPQSQLTKYAGFSQTFTIVCTIISPGLALMLNTMLPLEYIVLMDVFGAIIAVAFIAPVKLPYQKKVKTEIHLINDFKEGYRALKSIRGMTSLIVIGMVYCILYAPVGTLYPHISMVYFGSGTQGAAAVEFISAIGSLLGSLALGILGNKLSKFTGLWGSILCYGLGLVVIGLLPQSGIFIFGVISFIMGISIPIYYGIVTAIFQIKVSEDYLGRAFAISQGANDLSMPIGLILSGVLADAIGVNLLFLILGILTVILAVITTRLNSIKECCKED